MSSSSSSSSLSPRSFWLYCTVLFTIGGGGSPITAVSAAVPVVGSAVTIPSCDLAELFTAKRVSVEEVGIASSVVFRGLSTSDAGEPVGADSSSRRSAATPNNSNQIQDGIFTAYFELINTYKGAELLDVWDAYNFRRLNVTIAIRAGLVCKQAIVTTPVEYIVFCTLVRGQLHATSVATWDEYADQRLWMALGWSSWSDWSGCSVSCSAGIQQRTRHCRLKTCPGFNVEQRHCNLFSCYDSVSPLTAGDQHHSPTTSGDSAVEAGYYFHPSRDQWTRVPDRPSAWRLRPNSYIWLPSSQLFAKNNNSAAGDVTGSSVTSEAAAAAATATAITTPNNANAAPFPREFALFVTLRLLNNSFGTVFSLRSRRRQDTYLSLEAAGSDIKVIHAAVNGTDVLRIPAHLDDGNWHQVALSIRDDSVIDTYIDCEWSRTDILRKGSLDIPDDSDLIIGYLFEGDLDQMTIVPDPSVVSLQCSNDITPIMDPSVQDVRELQTKTTAEEATRTTTTTTTTTFSPILSRLSTLDYIGETVDEGQVKEQDGAEHAAL